MIDVAVLHLITLRHKTFTSRKKKKKEKKTFRHMELPPPPPILVPAHYECLNLTAHRLVSDTFWKKSNS